MKLNYSVIIVTHNHSKYISDCLDTALAEDPDEVIVVDSGSTDDTVELVRRKYSGIELIERENIGYSAGNNVGARRARSEYLVILNPDTVVQEGSFDRLLEPVAVHDRTIATPKILTYDRKRINTCGNIEHFTGLTFTRGFDEPPEAYAEPEDINGISGACFAISAECYRKLGGFDESFFLYMDDADLSWNAHAEGLRIRFVPTAIVLHAYFKVSVSADKLYHLERGRYQILRKYLPITGLLSILPALMLTEILTWSYAMLLGFSGIKSKVRAIRDGLSTEVTKVDTDWVNLLSSLDSEIPVRQFSKSIVDRFIRRVMNRCYTANLSLVKLLT